MARAPSAADIALLAERLFLPQPFLQRQAAVALQSLCAAYPAASLGSSQPFAALLKGALNFFFFQCAEN